MMFRKDHLLEDAWQSYRQVAIRPDASPMQIQETRRGFYAGATAVYTALVAIGDDRISEETGVAILEAVGKECGLFAADVMLGKA